jgi:hypothetical protein
MLSKGGNFEGLNAIDEHLLGSQLNRKNDLIMLDSHEASSEEEQ